MISITIDTKDMIALRDALEAALYPAKPSTAAAAHAPIADAPLRLQGSRAVRLPPRKFVRTVNLQDIDDRKTGAYLLECWAIVKGRDTIPKSAGKFHNRTLLAAELNRIINALSRTEHGRQLLKEMNA